MKYFLGMCEVCSGNRDKTNGLPWCPGAGDWLLLLPASSRLPSSHTALTPLGFLSLILPPPGRLGFPTFDRHSSVFPAICIIQSPSTQSVSTVIAFGALTLPLSLINQNLAKHPCTYSLSRPTIFKCIFPF